MLGASFDSTKIHLEDLLRQVESGEMQLPDFQRGWVWEDARIRSLLASISVSFPIGAIMTLQVGGDATFRPRPIEGAAIEQGRTPDTLLLDGQQRMTSLFQALVTKTPVRTRDIRRKVVHRHYYIDMELALSDEVDRDEWIVGVPEDRVVRRLQNIELDLSTPEREYEQGLFPLDQVFNSLNWFTKYSSFWDHDPTTTQRFLEFQGKIISRFAQYQIPVIALGKDTSKEAVCLVFEKVNTGGVTLTVFELVTASFAADSFQLRDDWTQRSSRMREQYDILANVQSDHFLQAVSLLATLARRREVVSRDPEADRPPAVGCRRRDILRLSLADYQTWADAVERGFVRAARFLRRQHVFKRQDVPYQTQLVPLAAIFADLGASGTADAVQQRIARWYWCGVMGEMYAGSVETIFARDLVEVVDWIRGAGDEPSTIRDSSFQANRLLTLRTRNSAAYKGIHALLMREGSQDFRTGEPLEYQLFDEEAVDIHHIFPRKWCDEQSPPVSPAKYNSIINKTAISAQTNRKIGGSAPSVYLSRLESEIEAERLSAVLRSHLIPEDELRHDSYWRFFEKRAETLLRLIEQATGKEVARDSSAFVVDAPVEEYDDSPADFAIAAGS